MSTKALTIAAAVATIAGVWLLWKQSSGTTAPLTVPGNPSGSGPTSVDTYVGGVPPSSQSIAVHMALNSATVVTPAQHQAAVVSHGYIAPNPLGPPLATFTPGAGPRDLHGVSSQQAATASVSAALLAANPSGPAPTHTLITV